MINDLGEDLTLALINKAIGLREELNEAYPLSRISRIMCDCDEIEYTEIKIIFTRKVIEYDEDEDYLNEQKEKAK